MLHQSPDFAAGADPSSDRRSAPPNCAREAERSLRMARVLAAGGFPEEALPLLAKAIGIAAAAKLAALGELAPASRSRRRADTRSGRARRLAAAGGGDAVGAVVRCRSAASRAASLIEMAALAMAALDDGKAARAA